MADDWSQEQHYVGHDTVSKINVGIFRKFYPMGFMLICLLGQANNTKGQKIHNQTKNRKPNHKQLTAFPMLLSK